MVKHEQPKVPGLFIKKHLQGEVKPCFFVMDVRDNTAWHKVSRNQVGKVNYIKVYLKKYTGPDRKDTRIKKHLCFYSVH
jgi:hypothetical protein